MERTFEELTEEEKKYVLEKERNINIVDKWYKFEEEWFEELLKKLGFYDIKLYFSGFYSQGDGASFEAKYVYKPGGVAKAKKYTNGEIDDLLDRFLEINKKTKYDLYADVYRTNSLYYHSNIMRVSLNSYNNRIEEPTAYRYEKEFLDICKDLADYFYETLEKEYEYLISDEAVKEIIISNEITFDECYFRK